MVESNSIQLGLDSPVNIRLEFDLGSVLVCTTTSSYIFLGQNREHFPFFFLILRQ